MVLFVLIFTKPRVVQVMSYTFLVSINLSFKTLSNSLFILYYVHFFLSLNRHGTVYTIIVELSFYRYADPRRSNFY